MPARPRRTLAFRLAMLGVVQLVLLATAVVGVGFLIEPERHPESFDAPPPPPPLEPFGPGGPGEPLPPPPGRAGAKHHGPRGALPPLVTFFVSGLVIVGIGSLLTARWIVGPLDALTRASRSLGAGDLRARTGLVRGDELGEVGRSFDDMAERVQSLLLSERELLANVSHELRTPLARIRVALDIASEADGQSGRASLADIAVDLSEMEALIDDILTTTRLDIAAGRGDPSAFALHPEDVTAEILCQRAAERFQVRHPLRKLEVAIAPGLPAVHADPVLFRRVLDNLLENAHKYSPDEGTPVALRATGGEGAVVFQVSDRGLGIPAEDLPRVFTPFFRGERSRSRGTGGVGLGLTLAKRIVEAHRGTIDVSSEVGGGTTVRVSLPVSDGATMAEDGDAPT
jgi:signal transduction histidine kinase